MSVGSYVQNDAFEMIKRYKTLSKQEHLMPITPSSATADMTLPIDLFTMAALKLYIVHRSWFIT